ncbi:hypothetical protein IKF88_00585 [Candidatus Saccharibacteria bacterium]|nr:hypothetical protein [Candidatus Saccharibacteria bacterium]
MDSWSKEEMTELRKFWQGEIGKKYIKRMEDTRKQLLQAAMGQVEPNASFRFACIANGFDSVLQDIEAVVDAENKDKEGAAKKK